MSEVSEKNKYELNDKYDRKTVRFRDLKIGEYFIFKGWNDVRLKLSINAYLNTKDGYTYFADCYDGKDYGNTNFNIDDKVYPLRADIRLDYIYEGKE